VQQFKQHIIGKSLALVLALAILTPFATKILHEFSDHQHEVCVSNSAEHYHKVDINCDLDKFNTFNTYFHLENYDETSIYSIEKVEVFSYYRHITSHQQLSYSLRGPPSVLV